MPGGGRGWLPIYPLELLHFLHKTEMLSKVLSPPLAIDTIWSAVKSLVLKHFEHQGCNSLANLDIFCHS